MPHASPEPALIAQVRFENALALFDEFVRATVKHPDAATLRGLERRFAEHMLIQPSYWSQIKSRSRQIGERLARQFEQRSRKAIGWMDVRHGDGSPPAVMPLPDDEPPPTSSMPRDDDERFIVGRPPHQRAARRPPTKRKPCGSSPRRGLRPSNANDELIESDSYLLRR